MSIVWRDEMSTGLAWQDEQHKELLLRINQLLEALDNQSAPSVVKELIDFLGEYAMKHFHAEEKYMLEHKCSTCTQHKKCHSEFIHNWTELRALYASHGPSTMVVLKLQRLLRDWLIQHMLTVDKAMAKACALK
jgi:hemerythrin